MEKIIVLLGILLGVILIIGLVIGLGGLIAWGVGNGIIYLFGLSASWTFGQGCLTALILYGIGWIWRNMVSIKR